MHDTHSKPTRAVCLQQSVEHQDPRVVSPNTNQVVRFLHDDFSSITVPPTTDKPCGKTSRLLPKNIGNYWIVTQKHCHVICLPICISQNKNSN